MKRGYCVFIVLILITSLLSSLNNEIYLSDEKISVKESGTAVRVKINPPAYAISADEVISFSATLYDSVNNVAAGDIAWSSSNGTITSDGTFYPWNAGLINIQARHSNLLDEFNITVNPGIGQSLEISIGAAQVLQNNILTANLIDAKGNANPTADAAWMIDGEFFGQGNPVWIPLATGTYELTASLYQMEVSSIIQVFAADPYEFIFPNVIQMQSGTDQQILPVLVDVNGYSMDIGLAGEQTWTVENGSINNTGWYSASNPGIWNVTVFAGLVSGKGQIRVVPSDATTSQVAIIPNDDVFIAGQTYELASLRTDIQGFSGLITPPIANFSVSSGTLSLEDSRVYWTPMTMGLQSVSVIDSGFESTISVMVDHGAAIDTLINISPNNLAVGKQTTLTVQAYDVAGNKWNVNGTMQLLAGNETLLVNQGTFYTIVPDSLDPLVFESSWYDSSYGIIFNSQEIKNVGFGELFRIELEGQGMQIPIDEPFNLNPRFFDLYGNELENIYVNWTIDGVDETLSMSLLNYNWNPSTIGSHEIQANAAGIFALVSLTVSAGEARQLITDKDMGFVVDAGSPTELFVQIADSRGNLAPAESITIGLNSSIGKLEPSISGPGFWTFTGKTIGEYELIITQENAQHSIDLTINPGKAVQIFGVVEGGYFQQGDITLLRVYGVDNNGNIVDVEPENTTISCTSGSNEFITGDIWELEISKSGLDRSCSIAWNGLVAQAFFDVESVLLGGAVGSTDTAMTLAAILLGLILATMIVLIRRANFRYDDYDGEDYFEEDEQDSNSIQESGNNPPVISESEKAKMAIQASKLGVMQAIIPDRQGASGWYVDVNGEMQYWNVGADGSWTRES